MKFIKNLFEKKSAKIAAVCLGALVLTALIFAVNGLFSGNGNSGGKLTNGDGIFDDGRENEDKKNDPPETDGGGGGWHVIDDGDGKKLVVDDGGNIVASTENGDKIEVNGNKITITDSDGNKKTVNAGKNVNVFAPVTTPPKTSETAPKIPETDVKPTNPFVTISLNGGKPEADGGNVEIKGGEVKITAPGDYVVTGEITSGSLVVDAGENGAVNITLKGAAVANPSGAAFDVVSAGAVTLISEAGTVNRLSGSAPEKACIYSNVPLTISGSGKLHVTENTEHAISARDSLLITGADISVTAKNQGIRSRNACIVNNSTVYAKCGGKGIRASNSQFGHITVNNSALTLETGKDALHASGNLTFQDGACTSVTGGGHTAGKTDITAKGLKAGLGISVTGGVFSLDCADDGLRSEDGITVNGGNFTIFSGDDGFRADNFVTVTGAAVRIGESYIGFRSRDITLTSSDIQVKASFRTVEYKGSFSAEPEIFIP